MSAIEEIATVYPFPFSDLRRFTLERLRFFAITARARRSSQDTALKALLTLLKRGV